MSHDDDKTATFGGSQPPSMPPLTPGTMLGPRYRIVSLIGSGGMGLVYRADDLKLGEPVALKFFSSENSLDRILGEVRIGRQVAHPNVCRLYDVVEFNGHHFVTMEFVDGEDLASVLRRHKRLHADDALSIVRGICHGLSAAHEKRVVHRDLKPGNVMLDGRGSAKITDFGLAARSDDLPKGEVCGTLNYMAPEQLDGGTVSFRTDLYSLGLVMYELFTGKPVFDCDTRETLLSAHQTRKTKPSVVAPDLDKDVERAIQACIEEDPAKRPRSASDVLKMLPGLDEIDELLRRNETPSPNLVKHASVASTLTPRSAAIRFAAIVLGLAALVALAPLTMFYAHVPLDKSPEVLAERAKEIAANVHMAIGKLRQRSWFDWDTAYLKSPGADKQSWRDLATLAPGPMEYVSYWTPDDLYPANNSGRIQCEPSLVLNHLNRIVLDSAGRLKSFQNADQAVDAKASGSSSGACGSSYIYVLGLAPTWAGPVIFASILALIPLGGISIIRNRRRGALDISGSRKLALYIAAVCTLSWACAADHSSRLPDEFSMVVTGTGSALFSAGLVWLLYLALEPHARGQRPMVLVGWQRFLSGWFDNPLIGRDILTGICAGVVWNLWWRLINLAPKLWNLPPLIPYGGKFEAFSTIRGVGVRFFSVQNTAVLFGLGIVFILTTLQMLTRTAWIAFPGTGALIFLMAYPTLLRSRPEQHKWFVIAFSISVAVGLLWIATRFGLLALIVATFIHFELCAFPLTVDLNSWFVGRSIAGIVVILMLAGWAALISLEPRQTAIAQ